ncbi:hypothetical protein PG988_007441 [Apiospora saccharicola]
MLRTETDWCDGGVVVDFSLGISPVLLSSTSPKGHQDLTFTIPKSSFNNREPLLVDLVDALLLGEVIHIHDAEKVRVGVAEDLAGGSLTHVNPFPAARRMPAKARYLSDAFGGALEQLLTAGHEVNAPVTFRGQNPGNTIPGSVDTRANLGDGHDVPKATEAAAGQLGAL